MERKRLLDLVADKVEVPLLFISGDRHISEISKIDLKDYDYPLYDITSSSLTSPWREQSPAENKIRVGDIIYPVNFATMDMNLSKDNFNINLKYIGKENEVLFQETIEY
jgi:alkaline phosphatase D